METLIAQQKKAMAELLKMAEIAADDKPSELHFEVWKNGKARRIVAKLHAPGEWIDVGVELMTPENLNE